MKNNFCNLIAAIKGGSLLKKAKITVQKKKKGIMLLKVLWENGYITGFKTHGYRVSVYLKYKATGAPVVETIRKVSSQRKKIYYNLNQLWKIKPKQSLIVLTTNKGMMSLEDCKKNNVGGKVIIIVH